MANPATTLAQARQDERIPGLPVLPAGTDPNTLSVPVYNPATDRTHQAPIGGPATNSNAVVGGPKLVQYGDSHYNGVPAGALTLDRLAPATIAPGTLATVDNPSSTPLATTEPPKQYVATLVPVGTAGAVLVPHYIGATAADTVPIVWQEVVAGPGGNVDAYTKAQTDSLLSTKQGAVIEQVLLPIPGAANTLPRANFGKATRLVTTQDGVLTLPTPTLADLGQVLSLHHYSGAGATATVELQATLGTDVTATYFTRLPREYVALLEVVKVTRGTPYNDVVASYAVLANSRIEPGVGYTDAQARAAQLGRVAPAGTTTITLTAESPVDYGTAASGTITVDPAGAVPGKGARFGLSGGANAPNLLTPAGALPYQVVGSYVAGKKFNYSLYVCSDVIQVVITQL
ncbi:MAG: hypothetical protein ACRYFZ_07235 [Janthinobacterium lividum]